MHVVLPHDLQSPDAVKKLEDNGFGPFVEEQHVIYQVPHDKRAKKETSNPLYHLPEAVRNAYMAHETVSLVAHNKLFVAYSLCPSRHRLFTVHSKTNTS